MKKFLRVFRTEEEYLEYTASTEFNLNSVSRCREGSLVFYNPADCGSQGIHRTISGETYCNGYDKYVYLYKQVSYDDGTTWETTATTSSLVEKDSEDCGYTPPTSYDIVNKVRSTSSYNPTKVVGIYAAISSITEIEIDGVVQQNVSTSYTLSKGEHTVKYKLTGTTVGKSLFYDCDDIKSSTFGNNITSIDEATFLRADSIENIVIGSNVTSIGSQFIDGNDKLTAITVNSNNSTFDSRNNCNAIIKTNDNELIYGCYTTVIPNTVTSIGSAAFRGISGMTAIAIPNSVTSIGDDAFYYCTSITSVTIPNSVTSIGNSAFRYCSGLTTCTIGSGVTSISIAAFESCTSLTSVTVNAVTPPSISIYVFRNTNNCPIYAPCESVDIYKAASGWSDYASRIQAIPGSCWDITAKFNVTDTSNPTRIANGTNNFSKIKIDGVEQPSVTTGYTFSTTGEHTVKYSLTDKTSIVFQTFRDCTRLTSIDIPDSVTSIDDRAFYECIRLTSVTIPNNVTSIGDYAFYDCIGLTSVTIPNNVTSIGDYAFNSCVSLTSCTIGSGVTSIGNNTFDYCIILTSIDIPDSVTRIGDSAFRSCSGLTSCTIGSGVTTIGGWAFQNCNSLTSIVCNTTTAPTIANSTFRSVGNNGTLTVPIGSSGYDVWMGTSGYYLGMYNWTNVEQ